MYIILLNTRFYYVPYAKSYCRVNKPSPAEKQDICAAVIATFPILRDASLTGYVSGFLCWADCFICCMCVIALQKLSIN